jgi:sensor histidine kinase YesM
VLSVINYFIEKKEMKNAALAITKMAALLRSTLDNMNENLVSFESEYKICDNYMYLESLRFSKKFEYRFKPLKEDVIKQWLIPPGIIEPLLENAVNHAFKGIDYKGLIALNYELSEDYLSVTVSDNGIGMGASNIVSKKSHGLKITRDYIKTVSNLYRKNITIDFVSNNGTTVAIRFPRINQKKFKKLKK